MAAKVIKYFLEILSDATFLSSIEYFDFKHRYVSIRRDFFNLCFEIVSSNTKILRPRRFGIILKELFLKRFCSISSTNLKKFFDYKISNSYFDYLNIARYYTAMLREDKIDFDKFFRNYLNKRNFKYYEKKGYKYFLYTLTPTFRNLDSIDNSEQKHENVSLNQQSDNSGLLDVQQTISDINIAIESDEEEEDDDHSYTSSEMREWLETEEPPFESTSLDIIQLNHFNQTSLPSHDDYLDMIESNSLPNATPLIGNSQSLSLRNQITSHLSTIYELENAETSYDNYDDFESDFDAVESRIESSRREISSLSNDLLSLPEYNDSELM